MNTVTTIGSAVMTGVLLYVVWKTVQTEKARNALWTGCVIFFFAMLFLNRNAAIDLTISETKGWWPVFSEMVKNMSGGLRDLLRTLMKGGA